jgi:hypothetical protein
VLGATAAMLVSATAARSTDEWPQHSRERPAPKVVTPGPGVSAPAPSDAVVLFDGTDLSKWRSQKDKGPAKWQVENGSFEVVKDTGGIETAQGFGDCQLHIEWSCPTPAKGEGQGRGNSGVFFGPYELQVLDSYENDTYFDGQAGAIYKQMPPMVNAMRPPGEWNVYDIVWTAPRFNDDGTLASPAFITAFHNGVVIQNHFQILGDTPFNRPPQYNKHTVEQPIRLQDHGNPVRFRNIWVRKLTPIVGKQVGEPNMKNGE